MKMKYWMLTVVREGNFSHETVFDHTESPFNYVMVAWELGRKTHLVNALEITENQYRIGLDIQKKYNKEIR